VVCSNEKLDNPCTSQCGKFKAGTFRQISVELVVVVVDVVVVVASSKN
jgi:hypothetical protein